MHTIPTPMASNEPELITDHVEFTEVPTVVMSQIASSPSPVQTMQLMASGDSAAVQIQEGVRDKLCAPPEHT